MHKMWCKYQIKNQLLSNIMKKYEDKMQWSDDFRTNDAKIMKIIISILKKKVFRSNILSLLFHWQNIYREKKIRSIPDPVFLENRIRIRSMSDIFSWACHRLKANLRYIASPHFLVIFGDLRLPSLLCPKIIIKN